LSIRVADVRRLLLDLPDVVEGSSYGMPSFLVHGHFLARFRDDDTVLALHIAPIDDRDVLIELNPRAFFFTDHYRDYPAVLIRLADVPPKLFRDVIKTAHKHVASQHPKRKPARK
jgi:hypothetical protein